MPAAQLAIPTTAIESSAIISPDGAYRYVLTRRWGPGEMVVSCMLNPSKAVNAYGLRSTDPKALRKHPDPVGPDNDMHIRAACANRKVICAWGAGYADVVQPGRIDAVLAILRGCGATLYALSDRPLHPLARVAGLKPKPWDGRR